MRGTVKVWQLLVALATTLVLAVAGTAIATIPDSGGLIHGCYKKSGSNKGLVKVIDSAQTSACPTGYAPLLWDRAGTTRTLTWYAPYGGRCASVAGTAYADCLLYDNQQLSGTPVAHEYAYYVGNGQESVTFRLPDGDISADGYSGVYNADFTLSIVGGTGAYVGASGTYHLEWTDGTHTTYRYTITYTVP